MRTRIPVVVALSMAFLGCGVTDEDGDRPTRDDDAHGGGPGGGGGGDCNDAADADGDGLDDCAEADLGTDPGNPDTDADGYTDGEEDDCVSDRADPRPAQPNSRRSQASTSA